MSSLLHNIMKIKPGLFGFWLLMGSFIFFLLFSLSDQQIGSEHWGIKIENSLIKQSASGLQIDLEHEFGTQIPKDLTINIHHENGLIIRQPLQSMNNSFLSHQITTQKDKIKDIVLKSRSEMKVKANGRLLQATPSDPPPFAFIVTFITGFFSIARNLAIIGIITGTFDLWMPLLMFIESYLSLALWTHNADYFTSSFTNIYNSKLDCFTLIRKAIGVTVSANPYLSTLGLSDNFIVNCAGELAFFVLIILMTVIIKLLSLFLKSQKLRLLNSRLRPRWNGYLYWVSPRILSMAGFCLRLAPKTPQYMTIVQLAVAAAFVVICIVFFALLVVQIRKISSKLEYIEESRLEIGLARRIDFMKDFEFDCLGYSLLYYPAMNYLKYFFSGCFIGFSYDFRYAQFGGVIAMQVIFMMIQISCTGYTHKRDKILYPTLDFIYMIFLLVLIGVGLVTSVGHMVFATKLETFAFSVIFFISLVMMIQTILDVVDYCRSSEGCFYKGDPNEKDQLEFGIKSRAEDFEAAKHTQKDEITSDNRPSSGEGLSKAGFGNQIKKIKNGKLF